MTLRDPLSDAYAQNYFAPNRFVPKSQRPKWRFKVKRFFNEINAAVARPASIEKASDLLEKLYQMLCYACDFVLFSAYDPFQSVGIAQTEFLDAVFGLQAEHLELGQIYRSRPACDSRQQIESLYALFQSGSGAR